MGGGGGACGGRRERRGACDRGGASDEPRRAGGTLAPELASGIVGDVESPVDLRSGLYVRASMSAYGGAACGRTGVSVRVCDAADADEGRACHCGAYGDADAAAAGVVLHRHATPTSIAALESEMAGSSRPTPDGSTPSE